MAINIVYSICKLLLGGAQYVAEMFYCVDHSSKKNERSNNLTTTSFFKSFAMNLSVFRSQDRDFFRSDFRSLKNTFTLHKTITTCSFRDNLQWLFDPIFLMAFFRSLVPLAPKLFFMSFDFLGCRQ